MSSSGMLSLDLEPRQISRQPWSVYFIRSLFTPVLGVKEVGAFSEIVN